MIGEILIDLTYLVASVLFIFGLKGLGHPRTAVRGNLLGATGMLLAVVATLLDRSVVSIGVILAGVAVGSVIGLLLAVFIRMTAMPQLVALFNGFGGGASVLVAGAALLEMLADSDRPLSPAVPASAASGLIGAVTFWGSLVAFAKLQELIRGNFLFPGGKALNAVLLLTAVVLSGWLAVHSSSVEIYWAIVVVASVLGVLMVLPIGGADMPVVIALLNALSGMAAAATGFVLNNTILIVSGALVGASGLILTGIMCRAMNRSLFNVLFGGMGAGGEAADADDVYAGKVTSTSPEEVAILFDAARRVVVAPGYGMAVSQAQHAVRDLAGLLEARGIVVEYAIHPVAGRMPGHMNVLLAEADVPYDRLKEMEEINPSFVQTDVVLVIGANDVVNPLARTDPKSPIAGMPILDVDKARTVVVIKRSLSPGFAGIPNPLFAADNTLLLFGDAKKVILELIAAVKEGS